MPSGSKMRGEGGRSATKKTLAHLEDEIEELIELIETDDRFDILEKKAMTLELRSCLSNTRPATAVQGIQRVANRIVSRPAARKPAKQAPPMDPDERRNLLLDLVRDTLTPSDLRQLLEEKEGQ